jgi:hypothetical protein
MTDERGPGGGWPNWPGGHFTAEARLQAATAAGHASLGWPAAGEIVSGAHADLVTVSLDSLDELATEPSAPPSADPCVMVHSPLPALLATIDL